MTYIRRTTTYVAGGNNVVNESSYPIRVIIDGWTGRSTIDADVKDAELNFMIVTDELPVVASTKDMFDWDGKLWTILTWEKDPADATTIFKVRET